MTTNAVVKKDMELMTKLGFYPVKLSNNKLKVMDYVNDQELHFELDNLRFKVSEVTDDTKNLPDKIQSFLKKDNGSVFESYEIIKPKKVKEDPFFLGIRNGKRYLISYWGSDVWEK